LSVFHFNGEAIMNFISTMESQEIRVELKYCERCGGLWLRPQGAEGVYCASCRVGLAAMPDPRKAPPRKARRREARRREARAQVQKVVLREDLQSSAQIDHLQGVATMEVWA
jgi:Zn-finger nucleic acid-binding protein